MNSSPCAAWLVSKSGGRTSFPAASASALPWREPWPPRPRLLLLDEPFSALDQPLRARMREEVARIQEAVGVPAVMVTHDPQDVEAFAKTLVAFGQGRVRVVLDYAALRSQGETPAAILDPLFDGN